MVINSVKDSKYRVKHKYFYDGNRSVVDKYYPQYKSNLYGWRYMHNWDKDFHHNYVDTGWLLGAMSAYACGVVVLLFSFVHIYIFIISMILLGIGYILSYINYHTIITDETAEMDTLYEAQNFIEMRKELIKKEIKKERKKKFGKLPELPEDDIIYSYSDLKSERYAKLKKLKNWKIKWKL